MNFDSQYLLKYTSTKLENSLREQPWYVMTINKNKAKYNLYFPAFSGTEFFMLLQPRTICVIATTDHLSFTVSQAVKLKKKPKVARK